MIKAIKRLIFKSLSLDNYLRLLQRSYFALYNVGLLRLSNTYNCHYFVKKLIKKGDVVIDIGANLGYYSILFAKWVGNEGQVYAVEPIETYNKIFNEKAKKYNNIVLKPYALGLEEKVIDMVSSPKTDYLNTGLPHVYDEQRDGKMEDHEFRFRAEMKIPSKLFGSLERIDYIKCDIEGLEYIVLSEMKDVIAKHKPKVQVEVWGDNVASMIDLFAAMGYNPYKVDKNKLVGSDTDLGKIAGDYIFIH